MKDTLDELLPVIIDPNGLNNRRHIANVPFLGKDLDRIVAAQLKAHLEWVGIFPVYQSADLNHHSTKTVSVKVLTDLLLAVDKGNEAVLNFLDDTAAFDTIDQYDHTLLLHKLQNYFLITGAVVPEPRTSVPEVPDSSPGPAVAPLCKALYPHGLVLRRRLEAVGSVYRREIPYARKRTHSL